MKQLLYSFVFTGILVISCNNTPKLIQLVKYDNGNKVVYEFERDTANSTVFKYFSSDTLFQYFHLKNGLTEGEAYTYFENGKLKMISTFHKGERSGNEYIFFEDGKVRSLRNWITIGGKPWMNNCVTFTERGDTNYNQTSYYTAFFEKDSIGLRDTAVLNVIYLPNGETDSSWVFVGKYDEEFNIPKNGLPDLIIPNVGRKFKLYTVPEKLGKNYLRACIVQYSDSGYINLFVNESYFIK